MISDYMHSSDIKMSKPIIHTAVDKYVKTKNEHCIVLSLNDDKTDIEGFGDNVWTDVFESESEIVDQLTNAMKKAVIEKTDGPLSTNNYPKQLPRLFALPGSKEWKGVKIRSQLTTYLSFFGYGPAKKQKYGEGNPPNGWPTIVPWEKFKGPSKGMSLLMCTEIILGILAANGIDPNEHGPENTAVDDNTNEEEEEEENPVPSSSVSNDTGTINQSALGQVMSKRQIWEEQNLLVFKKRKENMKEIADGLKALERSEQREEGEVSG